MNLLQFVEWHQTRRAPSEVDRFRTPEPALRANLLEEKTGIASLRVLRRDARGEVAEAALLRAERIRNINASHCDSDLR